MLRSLTLTTLLLSVPSYAASEFGQFSQAAVTKRTLKEALASYKPQAAEQPMQLSGTVKKVCEKKGCWMTLEDEGASVRVVFKGYSFFVPRRLQDKRVLVEGVLQEKVRSVREQKHLLEDAGASPEEIKAVKAAKTEYTFEAAGVRELSS